MKKIISILLALILALCPMIVLAAGSPTFGPAMVFKSQPKVSFMLPAADESWFNLKLDQYLSEDYQWNLMDVVILKTTKAYPEFLCQFAADPRNGQEIGIVLTDLEYKMQFAAIGEKTDDNWVQFDFSTVEPDTYIMFVYISKVD